MGSKITDLADYTVVNTSDYLLVVDRADTSMAPTGTNKRATIATIAPGGGGGTGTVTTVSIASANGFGGSVANPTTTPAITLTTPISGLLKGNSGSIVAATAGVDYLAAIPAQAASTLLGNPTGSAAAPSPITLGTNLSFAGSVLNAAGGGGGGGTVTTLSVASAHGFSGSVATATTTPVITLSTSIAGLLKGDGTSILAATAGVDYLVTLPAIPGSTLYGNPTGSTATPSPITLGTGLSFAGSVLNAAAGNPGTVTTLSVASANGLSGTVANQTTTPAITLSTTVTGLLKGNGTSITAATAGTDYLASLPSQAAATLLGNSTGSTAAPGPITLGTNLSFAGGVLNAAGGGGLTPIAAANILANPTGSAANPVATPLVNGLGIVGSGVGLTGVIAGTSKTASFTAAWGGNEYVVSGSADVTATLPTPAGNAGATLAVRCDPGYTGHCTLTPSSGTVGGAATRVILAGERVVLESDGTNIVRIGGVIIPCCCRLSLGTSQTLPSGTQTLVLLDTASFNNTGRMANTSTHQVDIIRSGYYRFSIGAYFASLTQQGYSTYALLNNGGGDALCIDQRSFTTTSTFGMSLASEGEGPLARGDALDLQVNMLATDLTNEVLSPANNGTFLSVEEVMTW